MLTPYPWLIGAGACPDGGIEGADADADGSRGAFPGIGMSGMGISGGGISGYL